MNKITIKDKEFIKNFIEDHLEYELGQLITAANLVKIGDEKDLGNVCSILRDSVYLHTRNLYNFFCGDKHNDISVYKFVHYVFDTSLYAKYQKPLHTYVLHIKEKRYDKNTKGVEEHINKKIQEFKEDIVSLWNKWIEVEKEQEIKNILSDTLERVEKEAECTVESFKKVITNPKEGKEYK